MRKVVDSNYLQADGLRDYLSKSTENYVVLTDYSAMEAYKGDTLTSIYKSMTILADYPTQVIVLKDTQTVCGLKGRSSDLARQLIDERQTREFGLYCQRLSAAKRGDKMLQKQLLEFGLHANVQMDRMLADAQTMVGAFDEIAKTYTDSELKMIRNGSSYSDEIIKKLIDNVILVAAELFRFHPQTKEWPDVATLSNTFLFRSALCGYLLALEWIAVGGAQGASVQKVRNDMVDINFAAFATYFDGLLSADKKVTRIYQTAVLLLETIFTSKASN